MSTPRPRDPRTEAQELLGCDDVAGASLSYGELLDASDQYGTALAFFRHGHELRTG